MLNGLSLQIIQIRNKILDKHVFELVVKVLQITHFILRTVSCCKNNPSGYVEIIRSIQTKHEAQYRIYIFVCVVSRCTKFDTLKDTDYEKQPHIAEW